MKIIALPDLHTRGIEFLLEIAPALREADLVLLPGDVTNKNTVEEISAIVEYIRQHTPDILAVCGNWDGVTVDAYLTEQGMNLHCQTHLRDGITFWGVGGALPFIGRTEYTEEQFEAFFAQVSQHIQAPHILVCHQPPYDTVNDLNVAGEHTGSHSVRKWIERTQPLLCFTGHIHEGTGTDIIGQTRIINPGPLWAGAYAWVEVVNGVVQSVDIRVINDFRA